MQLAEVLGRGLALRTLVLLTVAAALAGCAQPLLTAASTDRPIGSDPTVLDPVVIALIDSGASPYYEQFWVEDESIVTRAVPQPFTTVNFSLPEGDSDPVERDEELWGSLVPGTLYHFGGTRLLGISFEGKDRRYDYVRDAHVHGSATSFLAARDAPEAVVLVAQIDDSFCQTKPNTSCAFSPTIADAMEWVAGQDWIDIVSVSIGSPAGLPDPSVYPEVLRYVRASEAAVASGKIVINGAGNQPPPSIAATFSGPPWIVAVGGAEVNASGESVHASRGVDVVANFTDYVPMMGYGDMAWRHGTSFATPIVAGTLARSLAIIRASEPDRDVSPAELRDALNASARYFAPTDWSPSASGLVEAPTQYLLSASAPVVVEPQMGWGYVDGSLAEEIARRVLDGDYDASGKTQASIFQPAWQSAREEFWSAYGR